MSEVIKSPIIGRMKRAIEKVNPVIIRDFGEIESLQHSFKGTYKFASNTRQRVEQVLLDELKLPQEHEHVVFGNVSLDTNLKSGRYWFIDPLCGFDNLMRALPMVTVSLAVLDVDESGRHHWKAALVAAPILKEIYFGTYDGVFLQRLMSSHSHPIKLRPAPAREDQIRLVAMDKDARENVSSRVDFRYSGCPALDLCYVASGRLDGALISDAPPSTLAAGACLAHWAGARVSDAGGDEFTPHDSSVKAYSSSLDG